MPIGTVNNISNNLVRVNVGSNNYPRYYSISKDNADKFYQEQKSTEKNSRILSTFILLGSVSAGVLLVNSFSKKLNTLPRFILNTIGGISAAYITAPFSNMLAQSKENKIAEKYNATII